LKIAIASGKGGTGKTLVSTNLFYMLAGDSVPVTLVDCDAEEPNDLLFFRGGRKGVSQVTQQVPVIDTDKCTFCGRCKEYCHYNAIFLVPSAGVIRVMEELCHGCGACSVACRDGAITEKEVILGTVSRYRIAEHASLVEARVDVGVYSPVPVIKAAIGASGEEGVLLLDAPPGTSCPFIQTVSHADFVVLVTEPTPFGLSDLRQSVETLKVLGRPCGVIVNRAGLGDREIYGYLKEEGIPLLLEIPFDKTIAMHYAAGRLIVAEEDTWRDNFRVLWNKITDYYGNSRYQR
jgi:MinD superfamily P-loop ATPase